MRYGLTTRDRKMSLNVEKKQPPKVLRSVRISPDAAAILDDMVEVYGSTQAFCIEGLLNSFGPQAIAEAKKIKSSKTNQRKK